MDSPVDGYGPLQMASSNLKISFVLDDISEVEQRPCHQWVLRPVGALKASQSSLQVVARNRKLALPLQDDTETDPCLGHQCVLLPVGALKASQSSLQTVARNQELAFHQENGADITQRS